MAKGHRIPLRIRCMTSMPYQKFKEMERQGLIPAGLVSEAGIRAESPTLILLWGTKKAPASEREAGGWGLRGSKYGT